MKAFELLKCLIFGLIISAIFFLIQRDRGFGLFHCLSDAFFSAGALLAGAGGLLFAASGGVFDLLFYSVHSLFTVNFRMERKESFVDYKAERQGRRRDFRALLITGSFFILLSVIFLLLYGRGARDL